MKITPKKFCWLHCWHHFGVTDWVQDGHLSEEFSKYFLEKCCKCEKVRRDTACQRKLIKK